MARPEMQRKRTGPGTTLLNEAEYRKAWKEAQADGVTWKEFQYASSPDKGGIFHTERGTKLKPGTGKGAGNLSDSMDIGQTRRANRGLILNYLFGGTQATTNEVARDLNKKLGVKYDVHHLIGQAEMGVFVDDIIEDLSSSKNSKQYKEGLSKLEAGKSYFEGSDLKAGDVLENYVARTSGQHTGKGKLQGTPHIHKQYSDEGLTKGLGEGVLTEKAFKSNQRLGDDYMTDKQGNVKQPGVFGEAAEKHIKSLPWSKEESLDFFERNPNDMKVKKYIKGGKPNRNVQSRWSAMEDYMKYSMPQRKNIVENVRHNPKTMDVNKPGVNLRNTTQLLKASGLSGGLRTTDSVAQLAAGNYVGGTLGLAMQSPTFHKQVLKRLGKTFAKSGAKLIPGVGMSMGALEAAGYAKQGRFTQSAIAGLSSVVGELPGLGDVLSGGLDLMNTGIDIATGNIAGPSIEDQHKNIDDQKIKMGLDGFLENVPTRAAKAFR